MIVGARARVPIPHCLHLWIESTPSRNHRIGVSLDIPQMLRKGRPEETSIPFDRFARFGVIPNRIPYACLRMDQGVALIWSLCFGDSTARPTSTFYSNDLALGSCRVLRGKASDQVDMTSQRSLKRGGTWTLINSSQAQGSTTHALRSYSQASVHWEQHICYMRVLNVHSPLAAMPRRRL
ncbi:hypothetical protein FKP32DRAFT_836490 [Trametes sanguinea]|nr:hypothetical protein FKP32DRAFT_836490 [Trametes sanguinea]